jgi:hypothetical protein
VIQEGVDFFNVLVCGDGNTCSESGQRVGRYVSSLAFELIHLLGVKLGGCGPWDPFSEEALFFQGLELVADGGWGGEACEFADFAHRWWEAICFSGLLDGEEDLELAGSEPVLIGWAVWEL